MMDRVRDCIRRTLIALMAVVALVGSGVAQVQADSLLGPGDNATIVDNVTVLGQGLNGCHNANTGGVLEATGQYVVIKVDCWHGGFCPVCGQIDYDISNDGWCWTPSCAFSDPLPAGRIVTGVEVEVSGAACSGGLTRVYINDSLIGFGNVQGFCGCDTCFPIVVSSEMYVSGLPGYIYGGVNNLILRIDGNVGISDVRVKLYHGRSLVGTTSHSSSTIPSSFTAQQPVVNPVLTINSAAISQQQSNGGPVTVSASVANTSSVSGTTVVKVYVNGQEAESKAVTVEAGKTLPVSFTILRQDPGTYSVYVNNVFAGSYLVGTSGVSDTMVYGVIALFVLGITVTLFFLLRKRTA